MCKLAKEQWIEEKSRKCDKDYQQRRSKELYRMVKGITQEWKPSSSTVRDTNSRKTSEMEETKRI